MRTPALALLPILFLFLSGCEKAADISSPLKYSQDKLSFSHPGNWKMTQDEMQNNFRFIFVESPGDAIMTILVFPEKGDESLQDFASRFSASAREATPVGTLSEGVFTEKERIFKNKKLKGLHEKFSITLLGTDVPHIREFYSIESKNAVAYLIPQTASEDAQKTEPGFELILSTFSIQ